MNEEDEHFLNASHRKCILLSGTECHIINYLQTELAWAVPGNIDPRSFSYGPRCARSVLSLPIGTLRFTTARCYYGDFDRVGLG